MGLRIGSKGLALCAMLIGTAPAWALAPHDKAVGPKQGGHSQPPPPRPRKVSDEPQTKTRNSDQNSRNETRITITKPINVRVLPTSKTPEEAQQDQAGRADKASSDRRSLIVNVLLFLATLALWVSTQLLVRNGEKSSERQLRAYVHITESTFREESGIVKIHISYKNFGATPANRVMGRHDVKFREYPLASPLIPNTDPFGPVGVLGPDQEHAFVTHLGQTLALPEINDIKIGKAAVFCYGMFFYEDAFKRTRTTEYQLMVGGPAGPHRGGRLHYIPEGNKVT